MGCHIEQPCNVKHEGAADAAGNAIGYYRSALSAKRFHCSVELVEQGCPMECQT